MQSGAKNKDKLKNTERLQRPSAYLLRIMYFKEPLSIDRRHNAPPLW